MSITDHCKADGILILDGTFYLGDIGSIHVLVSIHMNIVWMNIKTVSQPARKRQPKATAICVKIFFINKYLLIVLFFPIDYIRWNYYYFFFSLL